MSDCPSLLPVLPTRVRRNYRGGLLLDRLAQLPVPADSDRPESWLASTVTAANPGLPPIPDEGLTLVRDAAGGVSTLAAMINRRPEFYLGTAHLARHGRNLGFLAKLLDSAMRLHVQVHPTAAFAREFLGSPYGKLEVYYVVAVRDGCEGYIRLGFQRAPSRAEWARIVLAQDIAAMDACFDRLPVRPGEVWIVPGGMPHAIGEGVLLVEVMEPSDLVVRCEFEREGVVVPPSARFMGRDPDFCFGIFDYTSFTPAEVRRRSLLEPRPLATGACWSRDLLVGPAHTGCFEIQRIQGFGPTELPADGRATLVVQTAGSATLESDGHIVALGCGEACFVAAGASPVAGHLHSPRSEILLCRPPLVA